MFAIARRKKASAQRAVELHVDAHPSQPPQIRGEFVAPDGMPLVTDEGTVAGQPGEASLDQKLAVTQLLPRRFRRGESDLVVGAQLHLTNRQVVVTGLPQRQDQDLLPSLERLAAE